MTNDLVLIDSDGEKLEIGEVFGFGEKMSAIFVVSADNPEDLNGININTENAIQVEELVDEVHRR